MTARLVVPSPNFGSRRGKAIRLAILHADASPSESATRAWIQNPASKVSYHLEVERGGTVVRYVADAMRAWAVGVAEWNGEHDVNSISLSASFANRNDDTELLTAVQIATMQQIVAEWRAAYHIEAVVTHAAVARPVGRKSDPVRVPNFDLAEYRS